MIQLPQLHESLLIANERLVDRARRRARLFRTGMLSSMAAVSIGGAAVAGQALWGPVLGREDGNRPTASQTPVPAEQRGTLGALRRDQTAADRGAAARLALAAATRQYRGVRLADVRLLRDGGRDSSLVLVPVAGLDPVAGSSAGGSDVLCVAVTDRGEAAAARCYTDTDVRAGRVTGAIGDELWGVVPDDVASVVVPEGRSGGRTVRVDQNAFTVRASSVPQDRQTVTWRRDDGTEVIPEGGAPMLLFPSEAESAPLPPGYRDCGADEGGVVPRSVECGAEALKWVPPKGEAIPIPLPSDGTP